MVTRSARADSSHQEARPPAAYATLSSALSLWLGEHVVRRRRHLEEAAAPFAELSETTNRAARELVDHVPSDDARATAALARSLPLLAGLHRYAHARAAPV